MLEIEPLLDRKPGQLSGGQRQRVAIGRAIVKQPDMFLFDEPLSNLDAALRSRTRIELARLHQRMQATMIFVTHDQVEAMTMATRIVVMNHGRIEQVGTPIEVYHRPRTRFVAAFIGAPAMNFLDVVAIRERDGRAVVRPGRHEVATALPIAAVRQRDGLTLGVRAEDVLPAAGMSAAVDVPPAAGMSAAVDVPPGAGMSAAVDVPPGAGVSAAMDVPPGAGMSAAVDVPPGASGARRWM